LAHLTNVKEEIRASVSQNAMASEVSDALDGLFTIEYFRRHQAHEKSYIVRRWREMRNLCILRTQEVGSRVQGSLRFVTLCYAIALMSLPSR
jgi:hypothetical protein